MSRWCWIVLFTLLFIGPTAAQQSVLDRTLTSDALGEAVVWLPAGIDSGMFASRVAMSGQTPLIFEATRLPVVEPASPQRLVLTGKTVREALDLLIALDARYTWAEANGVIVIRPRDAMSDDSDPLNAPVADIVWDKISVPQALDGIARLMAGTRTPPQSTDATALDDRAFSVTVHTGSVLDVLIESARAHGASIWFTPDSTGHHDATGLSIGVATFDGRSLGASVDVSQRQ